MVQPKNTFDLIIIKSKIGEKKMTVHKNGIILGIIFLALLTIVGCENTSVKPVDTDEKNNSPTSVTDNSTIQLSFPSGFYSEPFELTLSCDNYTIYYTLDGSTPTLSSTVYDKPIHIYDVSSEENLYATRDDTSIFFKTGDYNVRTEPVDKCTVLRAAIFDESGREIDQEIASYFVGFQDKTGYDGMNYISLVTDPENFFGYDNGIYVLGKSFDDAVNSGLEYSTPRERYHYPANYQNKGRDWEREVHGEFFSNDGTQLASQSFGIRIKGTGVRDRLPKSFNFFARNEYSNSKYFEEDLLNLGYSAKKLSLYACG
nr:chitobiase/beta-hexosaminidase C-terminal domain-containing protein [Lachnospiraceae bacterium]